MQNNQTMTLWAGLFASLFMYIGIAFFASPEGSMKPEEIEGYLPIVMVVALVITGMVVMASSLFKNLNFQTYIIIRAALSESIAVFGLVLCFLSGNFIYLGAFMAWSIGLFLFIFPSERARAAYEEKVGTT